MSYLYVKGVRIGEQSHKHLKHSVKIEGNGVLLKQTTEFEAQYYVKKAHLSQIRDNHRFMHLEQFQAAPHSSPP